MGLKLGTWFLSKACVSIWKLHWCSALILYIEICIIWIIGLLSRWLSVYTCDIIIGAVTLSQNLKENKTPKLKEITEIGKTGVQAAKSGKHLLNKKRKEKEKMMALVTASVLATGSVYLSSPVRQFFSFSSAIQIDNFRLSGIHKISLFAVVLFYDSIQFF